MSVALPYIQTAPFDALAERYDQTFTFSKIGQAQRKAVWKKAEKVFHSGDRILEIGCGTGVDACFMANHGVHVVATDSSSQMIAAANRRVTQEGKLSCVRPIVLAAEDIASLKTSSPFDGAFSNFGALNCVQDLAQVARDLGALLKPGAKALLCWLGPCCLWEITWYLAQGNPDKAFRRFRRGGVTAHLAGEAMVHVQYPSAHSIARTFAPIFQLKSISGVGVAVPPSYVEPWAKRFPGWFALSVQADAFLGHCPGIRIFADHILLEFQRKNSPV
jgi:ubiquinone/menaquinone biosynthesis C-methylase UbiE